MTRVAIVNDLDGVVRLSGDVAGRGPLVASGVGNARYFWSDIDSLLDHIYIFIYLFIAGGKRRYSQAMVVPSLGLVTAPVRSFRVTVPSVLGLQLRVVGSPTVKV